MPFIGWEVHDEGDMTPSAATSAFSAFGQSIWLSTEDASKIIDMNVTELTPETFNEIYADVWIKSNEEEASEETEAVDEPTTDSSGDPTSNTDSSASESDPDDSSTGTARNPALTLSLLLLFFFNGFM